MATNNNDDRLKLNKRCILILGGARSGKSRFAQELAAKLGDMVLFVATGEPLDEEMHLRIERHKENRPKSWQTVESPTNIGQVIQEQIGDARVVVIDCLTLLISNLLTMEDDLSDAEERVDAEISGLTRCMDKSNATFIIVSNEVGMGLVPDNRLGRTYRDLLGRANQLVAQRADEVYLMLAGIPLELKSLRKGEA